MSTVLGNNQAAELQHRFGKPFADLIANICTTLDTLGGDNSAAFNSITPPSGTLTVTGNAIFVDGVVTTTIDNGGFTIANSGSDAAVTTTATATGVLAVGHTNVEWSMTAGASPDSLVEGITSTTGAYATNLTPNLADAWSITDGTNDLVVLETTTAAPGVIVGGNAGAATTFKTMVGKKTAIADNTATDIITVTVPNVNAAAAIRLTLVGSLGTGTDTFESTRAALGMVVLARQAGANVVPTAIALTNAGIATVSGGGTLTLAYGVSAVTGAVGATNTFTIQVTLVKTGTITDLQCMYVAELINAETGGVTIARA